MSHSTVKSWMHGIFQTKNRAPLIKPTFEKELYKFIIGKAKEVQSPITSINGTSNHIHLLFLQNPKYGLAEIFNKLKGASSHWINKQKFVQSKFAWSRGYGCFSVSESNADSVAAYISSQKEHHKKMTFEEEYQRFIKVHGFDVDSYGVPRKGG